MIIRGIDEIKKSYTQSDCVKLPYTYNDFRTICNIVKHECTSSDEDEFKAVAYASYNRAKTKYANEKSWLKLLKSSYSSVNEIYKTPLDDKEKGTIYSFQNIEDSPRKGFFPIIREFNQPKRNIFPNELLNPDNIASLFVKKSELPN